MKLKFMRIALKVKHSLLKCLFSNQFGDNFHLKFTDWNRQNTNRRNNFLYCFTYRKLLYLLPDDFFKWNNLCMKLNTYQEREKTCFDGNISHRQTKILF